MNTAAAARAGAPRLADARRLVVKIGSALLVETEGGAVRRDWLDALADDIAALRARGTEVIVVSSGAIAVGRRHLGLVDRALKLEEKQAAAATGQIRLAHAYQEALARHAITVAQILLTPDDTEQRRRYLNARATMEQLLALGAVPVINENDTVATEEIRFGDNDRLAARVAQMISADTLVLFSDVDGLYTADPRHDANARHIPVVSEITREIEAMGGEAPVGYSSGGMVTKLTAAKIALAAGCRMVIARGEALRPLSALENGARCTWFLPQATPPAARKRWIAGSLAPLGAIGIDAGAVRALHSGKSLLPAGVREVSGAFERGDPVVVRDPAGAEIARGLSAYSAEDLRRIMGHRSGEIEAILGFRGRDEAIHRDDLVLTGG
jgi:glutamate 5-kinase